VVEVEVEEEVVVEEDQEANQALKSESNNKQDKKI
jgi:hypothetical protein